MHGHWVPRGHLGKARVLQVQVWVNIFVHLLSEVSKEIRILII